MGLLNIGFDKLSSGLVTLIDLTNAYGIIANGGKKIKPSIIHFEHGLRDGVMDKDTFLKVKSLLHANGYGIIVELYDVIAYQEDLLVNKNLFG